VGKSMPRPVWTARNTQRARELRNMATPAERELWKHLARSQTGAKFSRQMPVGPFFVDFLCRSHRLIVEVDGFSHDLRSDHDAKRDAILSQKGYTVLRFANDEVFRNADGVIRAIRVALEGPAHPRPLPQAGGETVTNLHRRADSAP
jgi:very-short-patch-repair endonuclease